MERDGDAEWGVGVSQGLLKRALPGAEQVIRLIKIGMRLAVLGIEPPDEDPTIRPGRMEWWHFVKPGSYSIPQVGDKLTYGTALCGKFVVTNGFASDFTPPVGAICPRCANQSGMVIKYH